MCVETLRTVIVFPRHDTIWGVPCLSLIWKINVFQLYVLWKHYKCVLKPSELGLFFQDDQFEGSHDSVYSTNERFSFSISWETPEMCVWNPQKRAHFSKMIDLRGHMPRLSQKTNIFPLYLIGNPINVCWNPQNRAHFSKMIDLRGHMPRFTLKMNVFPSISLRNPINVCWNPQNRTHFSKRIDLRGSHA